MFCSCFVHVFLHFIPLIAKRIDLIRKLRQILIRTAFILMYNCKKPLSAGKQPRKYIRDTFEFLPDCLFFPLLLT